MPLFYFMVYAGLVLNVGALCGILGNVLCDGMDAWLETLGGPQK